MSKKRIFLVEDESLLRELFAEYVKLIDDVEYLGSSGDGKEALERCLELRPDLILLDLRVPEIHGLEILLLLRRKLPDTKIIIFTGTLSGESVQLAVKAEAEGYVEKARGFDELKKAIETVLGGGQYFTKGADDIRKRMA